MMKERTNTDRAGRFGRALEAYRLDPLTVDRTDMAVPNEVLTLIQDMLCDTLHYLGTFPSDFMDVDPDSVHDCLLDLFERAARHYEVETKEEGR